jgi:hypothetical protein
MYQEFSLTGISASQGFQSQQVYGRSPIYSLPHPLRIPSGRESVISSSFVFLMAWRHLDEDLDEDPFSVLRFAPTPVYGDLNEQDIPQDEIFDRSMGGLQRRIAEMGLHGLADWNMCDHSSAVDYFVSNARDTR